MARKKNLKIGDSFFIEEQVLKSRVEGAHSTVNGIEALTKVLSTQMGNVRKQMFVDVDKDYPELLDSNYSISQDHRNGTVEIAINSERDQ